MSNNLDIEKIALEYSVEDGAKDWHLSSLHSIADIRYIAFKAGAEFVLKHLRDERGQQGEKGCD